ncbi:hypothetical protein G6F31_014627 [Rhizopus arrhizus]|nr:hypothetical protein G6F31_014627 [Rhizopus arrhizus]
MSLASLSIGVHVWQSRQVARQLQVAADALDDAQLLALLPPDAAQLAQRWRAGDERHAPELAVVMHLAVMHAALPSMARLYSSDRAAWPSRENAARPALRQPETQTAERGLGSTGNVLYAGSADLLAQPDRLQAVLRGARGVRAGVLRHDGLQRLLGLVDLALAILREADLEQAASGLVVGRIAREQFTELGLGHREITGRVIALAQPVQRVRRIDAVRVQLQEAQEQLRRIVVLAGLQRFEGHVVRGALVAGGGQAAGITMDRRRPLGSGRRCGGCRGRSGLRRSRRNRRQGWGGVAPFQPVQAAVQVQACRLVTCCRS